jgi:hypothetical protein
MPLALNRGFWSADITCEKPRPAEVDHIAAAVCPPHKQDPIRTIGGKRMRMFIRRGEVPRIYIRKIVPRQDCVAWARYFDTYLSQFLVCDNTYPCARFILPGHIE